MSTSTLVLGPPRLPADALRPGQRRSAVHAMALALVWAAVFAGAVVFTEPAPVDILTIGLIVLLPLIGLVAIKPGLVVVLSVWLAAAAAAFVASAFSNDIARSSIHSGISVYLYLAMFVFAAFVAKKPVVHARLILHAYRSAALVAALAGVIGYFNLLPGADEIFTKFGRAAGTFKDPNVYGPFLIPALLYSLHQCLTRPLRRAGIPAVMLVFLGFAILLSFSRGAWFNLAIAVAIYGYCAFICAPSDRHRLKMVSLGIVGVAVVGGGLLIASQSDALGRLLEERAQLTQSYDVGPEGRFGGHVKAERLILEFPLGIGAGTFTEVYHHEDVHNVYLSMFLNAGWAGGLIFILMCGLTTIFGLRHAFKRTASQALFLIAFAAFVGNVVEGFVIDIDHWRHFYLEMAMVWGLMLGDRRIAARVVAPQRRLRSLAPVMIIPQHRSPRLIGRARCRRARLPAPQPRLTNRIGLT